MQLSEIILKIHTEESEEWSQKLAETTSSEAKHLQEQINSIMSVKSTDELINWLINYCGDDPEILLNYLLYFIIEE